MGKYLFDVTMGSYDGAEVCEFISNSLFGGDCMDIMTKRDPFITTGCIKKNTILRFNEDHEMNITVKLMC